MKKRNIILVYSVVLVFSICVILISAFNWPIKLDINLRYLLSMLFGFIAGHSIIMIPVIAIAC